MEYFNPRSREGSDQRREPVPYYGRDFNPRSREGSDAALFSPTFSPINISIHAPAKGATAIALSAASGVSDFNPRSREGSDEFGLFMSRQEYNFNPRSREGSDDTAARIQERPAPISIHAPAKGATREVAKATKRNMNFNPRSREGSDVPRGHLASGKRISIHAPAKGATLGDMPGIVPMEYFNPRSREGSDSKNHQDYPR